MLDVLRERRRPPFSPDDVVREYSAILSDYRCTLVTGDPYGGEWPRERFRSHGILYLPSNRSKSELYGAFLPLLSARRVELPHDRRLLAQLLGLERRTARGGRESIDHGPGGRDDVANAAPEALVLASDRPRQRSVEEYRNMFRTARG